MRVSRILAFLEVPSELQPDPGLLTFLGIDLVHIPFLKQLRAPGHALDSGPLARLHHRWAGTGRAGGGFCTVRSSRSEAHHAPATRWGSTALSDKFVYNSGMTDDVASESFGNISEDKRAFLAGALHASDEIFCDHSPQNFGYLGVE